MDRTTNKLHVFVINSIYPVRTEKKTSYTCLKNRKVIIKQSNKVDFNFERNCLQKREEIETQTISLTESTKHGNESNL